MAISTRFKGVIESIGGIAALAVSVVAAETSLRTGNALIVVESIPRLTVQANNR